MFPDPNHSPPSVGKQLISFTVTSTITFNLVPPEFVVHSSGTIVLRAAMPIASVNEDRNANGGEDHIGGAA
jgi:hypothetical protein